MTEEKSKEEYKEKILTDLGTDIASSVAKKDVAIGKEIPRDEIIATAQEIFKEKMEIALKKRDLEHKKEVSALKRQVTKLKTFKPKDVSLDFTKDWDRNIEYINIEFYTLKVKTEYKGEFRKGQCMFCFYFEKLEYLLQLKNLWKYLGLQKYKYKLKIWDIDNADRFLNKNIDPNYDDVLTKNGMNWYYAKGLNIIKYPALDIKVKFTDTYLQSLKSARGKNKRKPNNFWRIQGIGRTEDGKFNFAGLIGGLIDFLGTFDEGVLKSKIGLHKVKERANDPEMDKKHSGR